MIKQTLHLFINDIEYKLCTKCKNYIVISMFTNMQKAYDRLHSSCKDCNKSNNKKKENQALHTPTILRFANTNDDKNRCSNGQLSSVNIIFK